MNKNKILIVKNYAIETNIHKKTYNSQEIGLATAFLKLGHDVSILFYSKTEKAPEEYYTDYGFIHIYYQTPKILLFKYVMVLKDFKDFAKEFDFITCCEYSQIDSYKLVKQFPNKALIYHGPYTNYTLKSKIYNLFYDFLYLKKLKKIRPIITTKSKLAKEYLQAKGLHVSDVVGVGLDVDNFKNTAPVDLPYLNEKNTKWLLYIGKIEDRKNVLFLIDVLKNIKEKNKSNYVYKLLIVGKNDPKYYKKVLKKIKSEQLVEYVKFVESVEQANLPSIYKAASWFLLPSKVEIWGMVLMEAMYFNVPIITTNNGGSSSLIINDENGYVDELNADRWADKILFHPINQQKMIQTNTSQFEIFNWDNIAEKMFNIIKHK